MALPINIEDLLHKNKVETNRIEFKSGWNPDRVYRSIGAFANDFDNIGGGYILIGVEEEQGIAKRPVKGIDLTQLDKIQREMQGYNNLIEPFYLPRPSVEEVDGRNILVIWAPSGEQRPYAVPENVTAKNKIAKYYIRNGATTIEAKGEALDELRDMANRTPFDERGNPDITLSDISPWLVRDYLRSVNSRLDKILENDGSNDALMHVLEQMDLLVGPVEHRCFRNVAAMMFCERPEKFFPYSRIEIVLFEKNRIETPDKFTEIGPISGSVPKMVKDTMNILKSVVIKERIRKIPTQSEALRAFNYPEEALEEAIVNALYHRSWQEREPVEITVEEGEISILNFPGPDRSIPDSAIEESRILKSRRYRNKRLGEFLKELDLTEGRSTGIPTIQRALAENGSPAAFIETSPERLFCVIHIPVHPDFKEITPVYDVENDVENDIENEVENDVENGTKNEGESLTTRQKSILREIRKNEFVSAKLMASKFSISLSTIQRELKLLQEMGKIQRLGPDKGGKWEITN